MLQGLPVAAAAPNWGLSSNYHCGSGFGEQLNIPLIAIIAIILGILAATGGDDDRPTSP